MTPTALTRTYYYSGELLDVPDFIRDQSYVRDLVAAQNAAVFSQGVAPGGMAMTFSGKSLVVSPGLAFNGNGVPIVLASALTTDTTSLNLTAGTYYVAIQYSDSNSNGTPSTTLQSSQAVVEQPVLGTPTKAAPTDALNVILGTMTVGGDGTISSVNAGSGSGRQTAGVRLAGAPAAAAPAVANVQANAVGAPASPAPVESDDAMQVGDALSGNAAPAPAPLQVGLNLASHPAQTAVASFGFQAGPSASGVVSVGPLSATGTSDLLSLAFNGKTIWGVNQDGAVFTSSDAEAKSDITPIDDALALIGALKGVTYLTDSGSGLRRTGVLAQDVQAVLPHAVRADDKGALAVAYTDLIGVLVEAVKALSGKVEALERAAAASAPAPAPDPAPTPAPETDPAAAAAPTVQQTDPATASAPPPAPDVDPAAAAPPSDDSPDPAR